MFFKGWCGMAALILLLGLSCSVCTAQFTMSSTQARLGESFAVSVSGAPANSSYLIMLDTDPGPTIFPLANNLRIDLGFSSNFMTFPMAVTDGTGSHTLNLISNEANAVGVRFHVQAINIDPLAPFGITASNPLRGTVHPTLPSTGTKTGLTLVDDGSALVPLGFSFPFYGQTYTEAYVNANGTLSFGQANSGFFITESFFLSGPPTIAALWTDLNPELGGTVEWDATTTPGSTITFRWNAIDDNLQGGPNTFSISLDLNGQIITDYGSCAVTGCISGVTGGMTALSNSSDLSTAGWVDYGPTVSVYEDFTSGGFDFANTFNFFAVDPSISRTFYH